MAKNHELTAVCSRCGGPPTEAQRYPNGACDRCREQDRNARQTIMAPSDAEPLAVVVTKATIATLYDTAPDQRRARLTYLRVGGGRRAWRHASTAPRRTQRRGSTPARRVARRATRSCSRAAGGGSSGEPDADGPGGAGPHDLSRDRRTLQGVTA